MAIAQAYSGTWTSTATETVLNTTTPETTDGIYQLFVDVSVLTLGKEISIRIKEKPTGAGDTQRVIETFTAKHAYAPDSTLWVSPSLILLHGWDMTLQEVGASSSLAVKWSIRSVA